MKNSPSPIRSAQPPTGRRRRWTAAGLALILLGALLASVSCRKQGTDLKPADVDYYTCTMHPSVRQQSPKDKCPICGMDLVPVKKKPAPGAPAVDSGICRSEEHTSELQSLRHLVCRLLLEKKKLEDTLTEAHE